MTSLSGHETAVETLASYPDGFDLATASCGSCPWTAWGEEGEVRDQAATHEAGTWTCNVCGEERPDGRIDVASATTRLLPGLDLTVNVRHCTDRADCRDRAPAIARAQAARAEP